MERAVRRRGLRRRPAADAVLAQRRAVQVRHDVELLEEVRRIAAPAQIQRRRPARVALAEGRQIVGLAVDDPEAALVEQVGLALRAQELVRLWPRTHG